MSRKDYIFAGKIITQDLLRHQTAIVQAAGGSVLVPVVELRYDTIPPTYNIRSAIDFDSDDDPGFGKQWDAIVIAAEKNPRSIVIVRAYLLTRLVMKAFLLGDATNTGADGSAGVFQDIKGID